MRLLKIILTSLFTCCVLIVFNSTKYASEKEKSTSAQRVTETADNSLQIPKVPSNRLTLDVWDVITYEGGENAQSITGGNGYLDVWLTDIPYDCDYDLYLYNGYWQLIDSSTNEGQSDEHIYRKIHPWESYGEYIIMVTSYYGYDTVNSYHLYATYPDTLQPDLTVLNIIPSNTNPDVGDPIDVKVAIKNNGTAEANGFVTDLFFNLSSMPQAPAYGNMSISDYLYPGLIDTLRYTGITSYNTGTWHMYALVDAHGQWDDYGNEEESNENNNGFGPVNVYWSSPSAKPDLIVEKVEVSSYCLYVSETLYVYVTILNQGNSDASGWFPTSIYYDTLNPPKPCWGCYGDDFSFSNGLAQGARNTFTFVVPYDQARGDLWNMYIVVDSDSSIRELNEGNNVFGPIEIGWMQNPVLRSAPITRDHIMQNALGFTSNGWICPQINATPPDECPSWRSDYAVGDSFYGVPYEWGGCDDTTEFRCNLNNGQRAGALTGAKDVCPFPPPPPEGGRGGWPWATGTECAGLVWHSLEDGYHTTKNLSNDGLLLQGGPEYLIKGDFLLIYNWHTFFFDSWAGDTLMNTIEAADFRLEPPHYSSEARKFRRGITFYTPYSPYKYVYINEGNYNPNRAGDANSDGKVDAVDITFLINWLFKHGIRPHPLWRGDANGDCYENVADIVYLVNYLYKSGPPPHFWSDCSSRTCCNYP